MSGRKNGPRVHLRRCRSLSEPCCVDSFSLVSFPAVSVLHFAASDVTVKGAQGTETSLGLTEVSSAGLTGSCLQETPEVGLR